MKKKRQAHKAEFVIERVPWACAVFLTKDGKDNAILYFMDAVSESEAIGRAWIAMCDGGGRNGWIVKCFVAKPIPT